MLQEQGGVAEHEVLEMRPGAAHRGDGGRGTARLEVALVLVQGADLADRGGECAGERDGGVLGAGEEAGGEGVGEPGDAVAAAGAEAGGHPGPVQDHGDLAQHPRRVLVRVAEGRDVHAATVGAGGCRRARRVVPDLCRGPRPAALSMEGMTR